MASMHAFYFLRERGVWGCWGNEHCIHSLRPLSTDNHVSNETFFSFLGGMNDSMSPFPLHMLIYTEFSQ